MNQPSFTRNQCQRGGIWVGAPAWVGGSKVWDPPSYNYDLGGWVCSLGPFSGMSGIVVWGVVHIAGQRPFLGLWHGLSWYTNL